MFTKLMKWLSIMALLLGAFLTSSASFRVGLEMLVCVAALVVATQAFRIGKYFWGIGFGAIAVLLILPYLSWFLTRLFCCWIWFASGRFWPLWVRCSGVRYSPYRP